MQQRTPIIADPVQQLEAWDGTCAGLWRVTATDGLNLREFPGGKVIHTLRYLEVVHVWCASGSWYCVGATLGETYLTGWSHRNWLESVEGHRALLRPSAELAAVAWHTVEPLRHK